MKFQNLIKNFSDFLASNQASYGSMREPITAPDGTTFEWDEEKKNFFDKDSKSLPKEVSVVVLNYCLNLLINN